MRAPLKGKRILDLGATCLKLPHALATSAAARICADYGAEVVRPVPVRDPLLACAPLLPNGGSAVAQFLNAGKVIGKPSGRFDAVIGDAQGIEAHPDVLLQVRISVLGPGEDPVSSELAILGLSGLLDLVGDPDGSPSRLAGHQVAYAAGLAACAGLLAAIRSGPSQIVDVSLYDVAVWLNWKAPVGLLTLGQIIDRRSASNPWTTVSAKDGHIALVFQDKDWSALQAMIGYPELAEQRFSTEAMRRRYRRDLLAIVKPWFAARTRVEITRDAQSRRIPIGPVLWPAELLNDAQYAARDFIKPDGSPRLPVIWDGKRIPAEQSNER